MHPTEQIPVQGHRVTLAQQHWSKTEHFEAYDAGTGLRGSKVVALDVGHVKFRCLGFQGVKSYRDSTLLIMWFSSVICIHLKVLARQVFKLLLMHRD